MRIGLQAWGSEGDIRPFTALAAGLVGRGHDVTLAVTDNVGRDYSDLADAAGYRLVAVANPQRASAEDTERVWRRLIELGNPIKQAELVMRYGFDPAVDAMYEAARDLCAHNDAVVGHFFVYPLMVAAEEAHTPAATVNIVHNCLPSAFICPPGLPDLGRWSYTLGWRLVRTMVNRIFMPRVNSLRQRAGLAPQSDVMTQTWASDRLNLVAVSPQTCQAPPDWQDRHRVCGFLNAPIPPTPEELPVGLGAFLSDGSPPVYLTFGSMMLESVDYTRETVGIWVDAVRQAGCRAIVQFPGADHQVIDTDRSIFAVRRAPYRSVFPRCAMVVHHGGAGTTQSTLLAGRPSIVVAHMSDQFFWGSELERLGVAGTTLKRKGLQARQLAAGIVGVLAKPDMASRSAEIGAKMAREDGVATAIQHIERELG